MSSDNEQRDELAVDIMEAYFKANDGCGSRHWENMANTLAAAGYRKPRTITTVEELDALPEGSVVLDGDVCVRRADDYWKLLDLIGVYASREINLPATVLHEPTTEATK